MWMGGSVPLGYDVRDRKLVVNDTEAADSSARVRGFRDDRFRDPAGEDIAGRGSGHQARRTIDKSDIYKMLNNRTYVGEVTHKGNVYPGEQRPSSPASYGTGCTTS